MPITATAARRTLAAIVASGTVLAASAIAAAPAQAHAIIELNGKPAYAGYTSVMTMEVQHGCLPNLPTKSVVVYFTKAFRGAKPLPVSGWHSVVRTQSNGTRYITWTASYSPVPFGTPKFLPIRVSWPSKPGVYGIRMTQKCTQGGSYDWGTPEGPATADKPSPPLTPLPTVKVIRPPRK